MEVRFRGRWKKKTGRTYTTLFLWRMETGLVLLSWKKAVLLTPTHLLRKSSAFTKAGRGRGGDSKTVNLSCSA